MYPEVKRPVLEADQSLSSNAEYKNDEVVPPAPIGLHGMVLN
jgi:hypothetical protein